MDFGDFGSGLKKINKKDPIKKAIIQLPPQLDGAIFVFGKIKSGKTVTLLTLSGIYHDNQNRGYKIFDAWGGGRNENLYWGLPSNKDKYWAYLKKRLNLDENGPKQYKVEYLYPMSSRLRKKLPFNPPNVTSKILTFDIQDIKTEDLTLVVGGLSENSVGLWNETVFDARKNANAYEVMMDYKNKVPKSNLLFNAAIKPLVRSGLLQNKNSVFNFGTKEISNLLDDKETITVLCLDEVEKEFQLFVIGYLIRKMSSELDRRRRKLIINMREVSDFFNVNDLSSVPERFKVMKQKLSDWIRLGRRGMHFILDVQSISDVRGIVGGQQDLTYLGRLPDSRDREEATRQLIRDGLIKDKHVKILGVNNPGQFVVAPGGKRTRYNYMLLPRCRYWEESNGNFYTNIWEKEVGRWINYDEERDKLKENYLKDKKIYDEIHKKKTAEVNTTPTTKENEIKEEPEISMYDFYNKKRRSRI